MTYPFLIMILAMPFYMVVLIGSFKWSERRRRARWPFKTSDRLRRAAGETLKRQHQALSEAISLELAFGMMAAAVVVLLAPAVGKLVRPTLVSEIVSTTFGVIIVSAFSSWRILRKVRRRSNLRLGWFGERYTAERLEKLQQEGYLVFHDVPCDGAQGPFNLDHVVLGPNGVFVVETKTRRKLKGEKGDKNHEVSFDGERLLWPWGADKHGVEQARAEAKWLRHTIRESLGEDVPVAPILALPGWYVREKRVPGFRVVNPGYLGDVIRDWPNPPLSSALRLRIAALLETRVRDVED